MPWKKLPQTQSGQCLSCLVLQHGEEELVAGGSLAEKLLKQERKVGSCLDRKRSYGGFMLPNTWEPEARGLPKIRSQPGLRLPKPKEKRKDREEETLCSFCTTDREAKLRSSLRHLTAHGHLLGWDLSPSCFPLIWSNTAAPFPPWVVVSWLPQCLSSFLYCSPKEAS